MRRRKHPPISAAKQYHALAKSTICPGQGILNRGKLTWEFSVRPTPLSRKYQLRINYKQGDTPKVFVDKPDLTSLAKGEDIPHVYQQKPTQLCLYLPGTGEWSSEQWIFKTIVPWSVLWLYFFEDWLATGEWKGGGKHPELRNETREKNSGN